MLGKSLFQHSLEILPFLWTGSLSLYTQTHDACHIWFSEENKHAAHIYRMRNENLTTASPRTAAPNPPSHPWKELRDVVHCHMTLGAPSEILHLLPLNRLPLLPPPSETPSPVCTSCLQMWRNRKHFKVPLLRPTAYPDANCKCPGHSARKILNPPQLAMNSRAEGRRGLGGGGQTSKKAS